jgi:hypothetical protein
MKKRTWSAGLLVGILALWAVCVVCGSVALAWPAPTPAAQPVRLAQLPATHTPTTTATPPPTATPTQVVTETPLPTDTPIVEATPTPAATATQLPPATPVVGIGLSRAELQALYEGAGFTFTPASDVAGQPRFTGLGPNGATVELIGPAENLLNVSVAIPANPDPALNLENSTELARLLQAVAPGWVGARDWLANAIVQLGQQERVETIYGGLLISLSAPPGSGQIVLTVRPVGQLG